MRQFLSRIARSSLRRGPGRMRMMKRPAGKRGPLRSSLEALEPRLALAAQFIISEFMASNTAGIVDADGSRSDWIEIQNIGDAAGNLNGHTLTDDAGDLEKWRFPSTPVAAGGFVRVFASAKDRAVAGQELHTNFALEQSGEYLALVEPIELEVLHKFDPFPEQVDGVSYGMTRSNGSFIEQYFTTPTPGAANNSGTLGFVADTSFSVDRGFFEAPFQVEIASPTPGAQIRYTLDGTPPTATTGLIYTGPITISTTTTLRAAAFKAGLTPTNVDTQTYIKLSDVIRQSGANLPPFANWGHNGPDWAMDQDLVGPGRPYANTIVDDLKSVPTLSLVMPWADWFGSGGRGIYISGTAIERAVSAEWINPDGSEGFQLNAAVEIQGGTSDQRWKDDKLSMQLKFKSTYGPAELDYDVFGGDAVDTFDTLILDSVLNYSWLHHQDGSQRENAKYIQDQFVADLQLATGGAAPHGRFVHLYLNGLYWGMYYVHERPDENFVAAYLGGDDTDYDVIKHTSNRVVAGSSANYSQLLNLAAQNLTVDANYQAVLNKLDIAPFIDYMIVNFYAGNTDWAHHNWYASFNRVDPNGKWHFHSWDAEHVLKHHQSTTDVTGKNDAGSPTYLHQRLATNAEYRLLFADRVHKHFFNDGAMTPANAAAAYQARMNEVDRAIVGESVRWGDNGRATPYTRDTDWFPDNRALITSYFPARTNAVRNQLLARGLYTSITPPVFSQHGGTITPPFSLSIGSSSGGAIYYTTDGSDPRLPGGAVAPTATLYSGAVSLADSTRVKARVQSAGNWSALTEALFLLPEQPLRIVEVNYAPVDPPAGSPYVAGDFEFIELLNTGADTMNLNGIRISEGISYTFSNQTLGAGQRIVVAKNVAAFQSRYGTGIPLGNGTYSGSLNNAGEELRLIGPFGETIQSFAYDNSNEWPGRADGKGSSLEIIDPLADPTDPDAWRSSREYGGSPGSAGVGAIASIVVNEVLTHTDPPLADAIELHNPTGSPIDLSGWYLSDSNDSYQKFRIPAFTVIPAGGYLIVHESLFGPGPTGFGLNGAEGDDVYLVQADPTTGKLLNFIDHVEFAAAANGESFGRWPNATGGLYPMATRTFGAANSGPRIGPVIISELMYNPQSGNDDLEYVELTNITDVSIDLTGWKFDAGLDFTFGAITLPADGSLVVLRFDPDHPANAAKLAAFRAAYPSLPQNALLVGGYAGVLEGGVLNNGGEIVRLVRPDTPEPSGLIPYLLVDEVKYDDVAPWPTNPDGTGASLTRISQLFYGNEPTNWAGQTGSPGVGPVSPSLGAPTNLVAAATAANRIQLTWTDNADGESGFRIERFDGTTFVQLATVSANVTSYEDLNLQSSLNHIYRVRAFAPARDGAASNTAEATTPQLVTINGSSGHDTYRMFHMGSQLWIYENIFPPVGEPTYRSEIAALGPTLTIDAQGGNDSLIVELSGQADLDVGQLIYNAGSGDNSLELTFGSARIDSTATGGTLNTTVRVGGQLSTSRLVQNGLTVGGGSRVTLLPDGETSVLKSLTVLPGATLDIGNNALVLDYTGPSPVDEVRQRILSGRGGAGLGAGWNGVGITSSAVAAGNLTEPESRSIGYIENGSLLFGRYFNFQGVPVDDTAVLIAYARTGDTNLNGLVDDVDVTVLGATYAPTAAGAVWLFGDFDYSGFVDDADATLLGAFYDPAAVPLPLPTAAPFVTRSSDRDTASIEGLLDYGAIRETFGQSIVRGQETRAQQQEARAQQNGHEALIELIARSIAEEQYETSRESFRRGIIRAIAEKAALFPD